MVNASFWKLLQSKILFYFIFYLCRFWEYYKMEYSWQYVILLKCILKSFKRQKQIEWVGGREIRHKEEIDFGDCVVASVINF